VTIDVALRDFHDAFAAALLDRSEATATALDGLPAQPGFRVYRNTVMKGLVDALAANFPAVVAIVGDEWFRAAARSYAHAHLPTAPMLIEYGASFPDFIAAFEPARELPYLADVARLDRLWLESHLAADAPTLEPARLVALEPERLARARLRPHSATRWYRSRMAPIFSIWRANRDPQHLRDLETLEWRDEGVLFVRPNDTVESHALDRAAGAFLAACARGEAAAEALRSASLVGTSVPLDELFARLIGCGAFSDFDEGGSR
jgi:hypothetical protein